MTARRVTAPAVAPVSLSEAKAHLRVDFDDDDAVISRLIEVAVAHVDAEGVLGRGIITQTWAEWFPYAPYWATLKIGGFQSLVSVQYYDEGNVLQTATLSDFETRLKGDFVIVGPKKGFDWPRTYSRIDALKITYTVGYGDTGADVPASVKHAILLLVGHLYEHRESVSEVSLSVVPKAFDSLLSTERVGWYG